MNRLHRSFARFIARFWRQRAGVAYIEFVLVFPFLFLLIFGGIELTRYILIVQKVEKAAGVMSSIVTQEDTAVTNPTPSGITVAQVTGNVFPNYNNVLTPFECCRATTTPTVAVITTAIMRQAAGSIAGCTAGTEDDCLRVRWQISEILGGGAWSSAITGLAAGDNGAMVGLCATITDPVSGNIVRRDCAGVAGLGGGVGTRGLSATEIDGIRGIRTNETMIVTEVFYQYQPLLEPLLSGVTGTLATDTNLLPSQFSVAAAQVVRRVFGYPRSERGLPDLPPDFPVDPSVP